MWAAAHGVLRLAHVWTLGEETHVVGWRVEEERAVRGGAGTVLLPQGSLNSYLGKRQEEKTWPLPSVEDTTESCILRTTSQLSESRLVGPAYCIVPTLAGGFPGGSVGRVYLLCGRPGFDPWVRKMPWRREWLPTVVFLPGKFHGQRSLEGCSPWTHKELDMTE